MPLAAATPCTAGPASWLALPAVNTGHFVLLPTPGALAFAAAWNASAAAALASSPPLTDQRALEAAVREPNGSALASSFEQCSVLCGCIKAGFEVRAQGLAAGACARTHEALHSAGALCWLLPVTIPGPRPCPPASPTLRPCALPHNVAQAPWAHRRLCRTAALHGTTLHVHLPAVHHRRPPVGAPGGPLRLGGCAAGALPCTRCRHPALHTLEAPCPACTCRRAGS